MKNTAPKLSTKPRLLFFGEILSLSHCVRPWFLARSIDLDQYDVTFACAKHPSAFDSAIDPRIAIVTLHTSTTPEVFNAALAQGRIPFDETGIRANVSEDIDIIARVKPDVVIGDFRLSLAISSRHSGVPYINLGHLLWSRHVAHESIYPANIKATRYLPLPLAKVLFKFLTPVFLAKICHPFNRVCASYGQPDFESVYTLYTGGDESCFLDHPDIFLDVSLPQHAHIIGPINYSFNIAKPAWWQEAETGRPWVYLCMGSTGDLTTLPTIIEGLRDFPVEIILSTAGRPCSLPPMSNLWVTDYLPNAQVLEKSALLITHGGYSGTYPAMEAGVPILGIPSNLDQFLSMSLVLKNNFGSQLRPTHLSAAAVKQAVALLLANDDIKKNLLRIKGNTIDVAGRFAALIQSVLAKTHDL